jgi:hypothetical protein
MSAEIWVAIITGVLTLLGVIITVAAGNSKTLYRIDQLEKKQDKHNTLIERMYRLEDRVALDEEKIKVANHRIKDLEDITTQRGR